MRFRSVDGFRYGANIFLGVGVFILACILAAPIGEDSADAAYGAAFLFTAIGWFLLYKKSHRKFRMKVTDDTITVDGKDYDRELWNGFITTVSQTPVIVQNTGTKVSRIDFNYGGTEETTKHWVQNNIEGDHVDVVNYLNRFIASIGEPKRDLNDGFRKQIF